MKILCGAVILTLSLSQGVCHAQSLFGGSGALGQTATSNGRSSGSSSGLMSGTGGGSGSASRGGASSGAGSQAGRSGSSANRNNASTAGTGSLGETRFNAGDGSLGATIGTSGFIGRGDNAGRFIGSQQSSATNRRNSSAAQFSMLQSLVSGNSFNQNNNANSTPALSITPQVQLGFAAPTRVASELQTTVQTRLITLPALEQRATGVKAIADEQGLVTLTGNVRSEDDRRMMEILVRMEPGVREVRNELAIDLTP